jgi:sulfate adenylyltransferase
MAAKQIPHGGTLIDLMCASEEEKQAAIGKATVSIQASERQLCDVELIMNGGFSPITGFMDEVYYDSVVENMALPDGTIFGLPVVFDTDDESLQPGTTILLLQGELPIATVTLTDKYVPNKVKECKECYGTSELEHPGTLMVATERGKYYMGGSVVGLNLPIRDFPCKTPAQVRDELPNDKDVVAFQCRNPVHRAHYELFTRALDDKLVGEGGIVLVHPTCGPTQVSVSKKSSWVVFPFCFGVSIAPILTWMMWTIHLLNCILLFVRIFYLSPHVTHKNDFQTHTQPSTFLLCIILYYVFIIRPMIFQVWYGTRPTRY